MRNEGMHEAVTRESEAGAVAAGERIFSLDIAAWRPALSETCVREQNPVPILYVRGDPAIWGGTGSVAVVGSRNTRDPYASCARAFAAIAARRGMVVVSGIAVGADSIGHAAAREVGGRTVCVMPCGLDKVFPPENRMLWEELLAYEGATFVSEFGFGQRASSLRLRKRNKLIVAFAQGVLVAQSATDGGAMNAYRFGRDQKKPVATFSADGSSDTTGNAAIVAAARTRDVNFELKPDGSAYEKWLDGLSSGPRRNALGQPSVVRRDPRTDVWRLGRRAVASASPLFPNRRCGKRDPTRTPGSNATAWTSGRTLCCLHNPFIIRELQAWH